MSDQQDSDVQPSSTPEHRSGVKPSTDPVISKQKFELGEKIKFRPSAKLQEWVFEIADARTENGEQQYQIKDKNGLYNNGEWLTQEKLDKHY
ncbi:hypothetical protein PG985_009954 [Apiospora marii]|uniref:uncharacterized protein n=1 Tax=Apiospora marii TaxID=335849 RepID=UPI00312CD593